MPRYRWIAFLAFTFVLVVVGCKKGPAMAEVEGVIKVKGKPVDKIHVEFWPTGSAPRSMGMTDENGRYTLKSDDGKYVGAVVGSHKIVLRDLNQYGEKFVGRGSEDMDLSGGKKPRINASYGDVGRTPLSKEVTSGKNEINLDVNP